MKFSKKISNAFIDALNGLYDSSDKPWWRTVADDKDNFLLIRNNEIRVQVNGGLLLQINQDSRNNIVCKTHEEYLSLRSEGNPYVVLGDTSTEPIKRVEGLNGLVKHYDKIKNRIRIFSSREKQAVQHLASNIPQMVDIEIGFEGELKESAAKRSVPRIDMAAITNEGVIVFYEVKLFDNSEIRSEQTPSVIGQLKKYERWMAQHKKDIIAGYKEQLNIYGRLKGRFFTERFKSHKIIDLYPHPRLIITGFDGSQRDKVLPSILSKIRNGVEWMEGDKDLIAAGNHKSLAKSNRLFLGIK